MTIVKHGKDGAEDQHLDRLFEGMSGETTVRAAPDSGRSQPDSGSASEQVWMSHSDRLHTLPEGFVTIATTPSAPFAAVAHQSKPIYGVQVRIALRP